MLGFVHRDEYGVDWSTEWSPAGEVRKPPVAYRLLIPAVTQVARSVMPGFVKEAVTPLLIKGRDTGFVRQCLSWDYDGHLPQIGDAYIFDSFVKIGVIYAFLLAFIWMLYVLARALFPESTLYALLAPALALLVMVPFEKLYAYSYDFSELFFSCACFYLLLKERWRAYLVCLALAMFNKETTMFIMFFYFIWFYGKMPRKRYLQLGLLQIAICVLIEGMVRYYTMGNLFVYTQDAHFIQFRRVIPFMIGYDYTTAIHIVILGVLMTYRWMDKPAFLRVGSWVVGVNVGAFLLTCNPGEYRDLYFSLPVWILLATHTLVSLSGAAQLPLFRPKNA